MLENITQKIWNLKTAISMKITLEQVLNFLMANLKR